MTDALAIDLTAPCWLWQGKLSKGYGRKRVGHRMTMAHRYMWTVMRGPIPEKMQIDHLCGVRHCVNPQHLEVVTTAEHSRRNALARPRPIFCPHGHRYDTNNTYFHGEQGHRYCRTCNRESHARRAKDEVRF